MSSGAPQRDRDREARERAQRRAAAGAGRPGGRAARQARRRRGVPLLAAVLIAVAALAIGLVAGYASRGDRAPAELITVDTPVRVLTVTVEAPTPVP